MRATGDPNTLQARRWAPGLALLALLPLSLQCTDADGPGRRYVGDIENLEMPIVGGHTTTGWDSVVFLGMWDGNWGSICSGTLVSPDVVLTAAHCIEDFNATIEIYWCDQCYQGQYIVYDWMRTSNDYHEHPQYVWQGYTVENDIAVVVLGSNGPTTPVPINRDSPSNSWLGNSHPIPFIGFGDTHYNGDDSGTKREVDIPVTNWDSQFLLYTGANHNTCQGDSGGPAMTDHQGGWHVAGVTSWGSGESCTSESGSTRVDQHEDWVDSYTGGWMPDDDDTGDDDTGDDDTGDDDTGDDDTGDDDTGDDDTGDDDIGDDDTSEPPHDELPPPRTSGQYGMPEGMNCIASQAGAAAGTGLATLLMLAASLTLRLRRR